jgi:hypothetical protein
MNTHYAFAQAKAVPVLWIPRVLVLKIYSGPTFLGVLRFGTSPTTSPFLPSARATSYESEKGWYSINHSYSLVDKHRSIRKAGFE